MADRVDIAQAFEQTELAYRAQLAKTQAVKLPETGFCHNCGKPAEEGQVFCDGECAEEWDWVQARKRMNIK